MCCKGLVSAVGFTVHILLQVIELAGGCLKLYYKVRQVFGKNVVSSLEPEHRNSLFVLLCMEVFQGLVALFVSEDMRYFSFIFFFMQSLEEWYEVSDLKQLGSTAAFFTNVSACSLPKFWQCQGNHCNTTFFSANLSLLRVLWQS